MKELKDGDVFALSHGTYVYKKDTATHDGPTVIPATIDSCITPWRNSESSELWMEDETTH